MYKSYCITMVKGKDYKPPRFLPFTWDIRDSKTGTDYLVLVIRTPSEADLEATLKMVIEGFTEIFFTKTPREWVTWKDLREDPDMTNRLQVSAAFDSTEIETVADVQKLYLDSRADK